jgi:hypothetical protein
VQDADEAVAVFCPFRIMPNAGAVAGGYGEGRESVVVVRLLAA